MNYTQRKMALYIPSRSRWGRCLTLNQLGAEALQGRRVFMVVPHEQRNDYIHLAANSTTAWGCRVPVLSWPKVKGIARTRQAIGLHAAEEGYPSFLMLDDDLRFAYRTNPKETDNSKRKLAIADSRQCSLMLHAMENALSEHAHGAIRHRMAYNDKNLKYPREFSVRALRALGYQTHLFNTCKHGRVDIMEDFDVTLQLLARGHPNCVLTHWVQDQSQTQAQGGCSDYRTHQLHARSVTRMAKLWGDRIVKLREKQNKTGGEFGTRLEATIFWKKSLGMFIEELT